MYRSTQVPVVALALALTAAAAPATAAPVVPGVYAAPKGKANARKNIAIGQVEGPKAAKIRLALMQRLKDSPSFTLTDAEDLKSTASKATIAKMAKALQVDAVILGKVSQSSDLTVNVYKSDGRLVDQIKVKGGSPAKLDKAIQNEFDVTIAPPLAEASGAKLAASSAASAAAAPVEEEEEPEAAEAAPAAAEPPAEEPADSGGDGADDAAPAEEDKPKDDGPKGGGGKAGRTPFELTAGIRGYSRHFKYTGTPWVRNPALRRTIRPYNLGFAPALLVNGVVYPGAFVSDGWLSHIGLMAGAELGIATSTDYEQLQTDNTKLVRTLQTSAQSWDVGLRGRIPIGPAEVALYVEYGTQSFILHGDEGGNELSPLVPDVQYGYVRLGLEPRVRIGKVTLGGHLAPRILTSLHQIDLAKVWFPGAHGRGLDFGLMAGYGLTSFLDVVGGADFVGYGFDFNPLPLDPVLAPIAAGGATDYYESLWLGLRLTLGGSPPK